VVAERNFIGPEIRGGFIQKAKPFPPQVVFRGHARGNAGPGQFLRHKTQAGFLRQPSAKRLVLVGGCAAQAMVEMGGNQFQPPMRGKGRQRPEQRAGIRPPGQSDHHPVAFFQQGIFSKSMFYFLEHGH